MKTIVMQVEKDTIKKQNQEHIAKYNQKFEFVAFPLVNNAALAPLQLFRKLKVRKNLIKERGLKTVATGL